MIVQWIVQALAATATWLVGLFPTVAVPSWVGDSGSQLHGLLVQGASMGSWVPWTVLLSALAVALAANAAGFTIKLLRIGLSFLTLGGGSAA